MTGAGFYVTGEGGLSSVAAIYGSLFQQEVQKRTEQEKKLHFMLYFSRIWTQAGYKQYCCTLFSQTVKCWVMYAL